MRDFLAEGGGGALFMCLLHFWLCIGWVLMRAIFEAFCSYDIRLCGKITLLLTNFALLYFLHMLATGMKK